MFQQDQQQQQEWIIVKPKRKPIKKQQKHSQKSNPNPYHNPYPNTYHKSTKKYKIVHELGKPLYLAENQEGDVEEFLQSEAYRVNLGILRRGIEEVWGKEFRDRDRDGMGIQVECLGLGDFVKYVKPRFQFYFLKYLLIPLCQQLAPTSTTLNCYDPIFPPPCLQTLQSLPIPTTTTPNNLPSESPKKLLILFMPHCQRFLYQRYCNKYKNNRVLVIGNSLREYRERCQLVSEVVPEGIVGRGVGEVRMRDFGDCFNDTFCYWI